MKRVLLYLAMTMFLTVSCQVAEQRPATRNIVLLIGDGMSVAQLQAGMLASQEPLQLEQFRHIGFQKTAAADHFVTCSAASATALATGTKTNNGYLGVDPEGRPLKTILQIASDQGLATGLVATSYITHATPAAFIAHQPSRNMYEEIAQDFLATEIDVFIGGGRQHFVDRQDGRKLLEELAEKGYRLASTMEEVEQVQSGKLAALVAEGHPPRYADNRGNMLPDAAAKAIELLSQNPSGFFLMIEGSQIDWGGHANDTDYIVEEMLDFDRTVGKVLEFARQNRETLVIVTGDHETGGMTLNQFDPETGKLEARYTTGGHTGIMLPVFAYGPGAGEFVGIYENTAIFSKMLHVFGFSEN